MNSGAVCRLEGDFPWMSTSTDADPDRWVCPLPVRTESEAADFLETLGSGGSFGTGTRLIRDAHQIPMLRAEYERLVGDLVDEVRRRRSAGQSAQSIADWIVRERTRIARHIRQRAGVGATVLFEIRDWKEYGVGGRTYRNIERRYTKKGYSGAAKSEAMIRGATRPQAEISKTAVAASRYLRHGGRVIVVISVASTAYVLLTSPREELEHVIFTEAGGALGGMVGTSGAVGLCLAFGIATGGWGLLGCGVLGGAAGGALGHLAGDAIYYLKAPLAGAEFSDGSILDDAALTSRPPVDW